MAVRRFGQRIRVKPEAIEAYERLHAAPWPGVLDQIRRSNIRNYTIFLREPENLMFGYWEYHGTDFAADMAHIAADPETQRWWTFCSPCQVPLASRAEGEHWAMMEPVFHMD